MDAQQLTPQEKLFKQFEQFQANNPAASVNPLRKSFEHLVRLGPAYHHLADKDVMDSPHSFLRDPKKVSLYELDAMISNLLMTTSAPQLNLRDWAGTVAYPHVERGIEASLSAGRFPAALAKTLDTTFNSGTGIGPGALIRTDLEPLLHEAYLRTFPFAELVRSFPANGLVHTYDVRTGPPTAATMAETDSVSGLASSSTIKRRANSNLAVIAAKVGVTLKLQFASLQSGMNYGLGGSENLEAVGAIVAISAKLQQLMLQGNFSTAGKTLDDEEGVYDANAFDGLRALLKGASNSMTKTNNDSYIDMINKAVAAVANAGGAVNDLRISRSFGQARSMNVELQDFLRVVNVLSPQGIPTNLSSAGIVTVADFLARFITIPGALQTQGSGWYTFSDSQVYEDLMVFDPAGLGMAYLGSPSPTILELPVGFDNTLSSQYIVFYMGGLTLQVPEFAQKIRALRVT